MLKKSRMEFSASPTRTKHNPGIHPKSVSNVRLHHFYCNCKSLKDFCPLSCFLTNLQRQVWPTDDFRSDERNERDRYPLVERLRSPAKRLNLVSLACLKKLTPVPNLKVYPELKHGNLNACVGVVPVLRTIFHLKCVKFFLESSQRFFDPLLWIAAIGWRDFLKEILCWNPPKIEYNSMQNRLLNPK